MLEWKNRQATFHRLNVPDDLLANKKFIVREYDDDDLIADIIDYFETPSEQLVYPAKSYAVAIIYAQLLVKYFGVDFYEVLCDKKLLYDNDSYFVPYQHAKPIYDKVLSCIQLSFDNPTPQVQTTIDYFLEEFYISIA